MLRITIELIPYGQEDKKETIGTMEVWNVKTTHLGELGDYQFKVNDNRGFSMEGEIHRHKRLQRGVWYLIRKVLYQLPLLPKKKEVTLEGQLQLLFRK